MGMKLLLFGATGGTGRELLKQSIAKDHEVTAFVRDPSRLGDIAHPDLRLVTGDVLDPAAVRNAVSGHEAVLIAIGAGPKRTTIREQGTRIVIEAMQAASVKRLVCLSSFGVGDSRADLSFFTRYVVVGIFLRHAFADHERQEAVVRNSALDWTLVRPPHLKDGAHTGTYQHGLTLAYGNIKGWISRGDLADFMLKQLEDDRYIRQAPRVSY
jgi:putative NADH-flavin reductase